MSDSIKKNILVAINIIIKNFETLSMIFSKRQWQLLTSTKSSKNSNTINLST